MHAVVMYESMFGNTKRIAEAVARGLSGRMTVTVTPVTAPDAGAQSASDLLVIGAPTHAFTLPAPNTRRQAVARSDDEIDVSTGVREFLMTLPAGSERSVAAFDTRHRRMRFLPGSAARAAGRMLSRAGYRLLAPAQSFYVAGMAGPLLPGELDRAVDWGEQLGRLAVLTEPPPVGSPGSTG
jgi:hypothetical protein